MRASAIWKTLAPAIALAASGCVAGPQSGPTSPNLPFDGLFQGQVTPIKGGPPACAGDEYGTIQIGDGTFLFPYRRDVVFNVPIAKDGAIKAQDNGTTLDGRLAGDRLDVTVSNPTCNTHYAMRRLLGM